MRAAIVSLCILLVTSSTTLASEIHETVKQGDQQKVRSLLRSNPALIESQDARGLRPLYFAVLANQTAIVRLLLEKGATIDNKNGQAGVTALHAAAGTGNKTLTKLLLGRGANPNVAVGGSRRFLLLRIGGTPTS